MDNLRIPLYLGLLLVAFLLWQRWEEAHRPPPVAAGGDTVGSELPDAVDAADSGDSGGALDDAPEAVATAPDTPPPAVPEDLDSNTVVRVVTDLLDLDIATRGGDIIRLDLRQVKRRVDDPTPFRLLGTEGTAYIVQSGLLHDRVAGATNLPDLAPSHRAQFTAEGDEHRLRDGEEALRVPLRWERGDGLVVEKHYVFRRDSYEFHIEHVVRNQSGQAWIGRQYRQLRRGAPRDDGSRLLYTFTGASYYDGQFNKLNFEDLAEEPLAATLRGGWVAMLQHYFVSALLPDDDNEEFAYSRVVKTAGGPEYLAGLRSGPVSVAPDAVGRFRTGVFAGPKIQSRLDEAADGLYLAVDYGFLTIIAQPMFYGLRFIHEQVGNWGLAIILLTVLIKLVFYKLSEMSYRSMARMRKFQPRFSALREKHRDDREQLNKAVMELYRKEKINPLGGCLPILVQVPFFIALYWTLLESAELRQAPFIFWLQDLSARDPYFVLPLIMGATMIFQTHLNPTPPDPMQAKVVKYMPYVFTLFFAFFPSGLVLYWSINNLLSIAQQWHITRRMEQSG